MPTEQKFASVTYIEAISQALRDELRSDSSVFLMGQDIAEYGGAFKVSRGFVDEFGKERIVNTPIAESGMIGMAVGAALLGRRPVVEMQFGDFISCGFNQVSNVAAKTYWRTGMPVPMVIRLPVGAGMGAGPFHSQSMEAWFLHTPGLKVVAPAWPADAYHLLRAAIRDPNPVLYLEHKNLYRRLKGPLQAGTLQTEPQVDPAAVEALRHGKACVMREGTAATVITYGHAVHLALEAADELAGDGVSVAVLDLRTLMPFDQETLLESVRGTGRVLIVHEAGLTGGFGGEIAARIADQAFEYLDAPVRRLAFPDHPVPFHKDLEAACLPSTESITSALRELLRW